MALSSMFKCPSCDALFGSRYRMEQHQFNSHDERSVTEAEPVAPDVAGYLNLDDLARAVHGHEVIAIPMGDLRDTYGAERLGVEVCEKIHQGLLRRNLAHFPTPLPRYQGELVVIYELGGPVSGLISEAVGDPHVSFIEMSRFVSQLIRQASQARVKLNTIQAVLTDEDSARAANPGDED